MAIENICGLWKKVTQNGNQYLSGKLTEEDLNFLGENLQNGEVWLKIFQNTRKEGRQPDYNLTISVDDPAQQQPPPPPQPQRRQAPPPQQQSLPRGQGQGRGYGRNTNGGGQSGGQRRPAPTPSTRDEAPPPGDDDCPF